MALASNAAVLDLQFHPSALKRLPDLCALIKTYFDLGGVQTQMNVFSREVLCQAKKYPERYQWLLVRVWGFSARFVSLSPELQDHIISRTAYSGERI